MLGSDEYRATTLRQMEQIDQGQDTSSEVNKKENLHKILESNNCDSSGFEQEQEDHKSDFSDFKRSKLDK